MTARWMPPLPSAIGNEWQHAKNEELRAYGQACARAALEQAAKVCEDQTQQYEQHTGQPMNLAYQCADAIRALAREVQHD